jgi:hypothetical protein
MEIMDCSSHALAIFNILLHNFDDMIEKRQIIIPNGFPASIWVLLGFEDLKELHCSVRAVQVEKPVLRFRNRLDDMEYSPRADQED